MAPRGARDRLHATLFRSGRLGTDTLVVSPYPVGGNDANTGPRYAAEARLTGYDVLGVTRTGSNTLVPSHVRRRQLAPHVFDELCESLAKDLAPVCAGYDHVVVRGQSTGTFPALGIVRSGVLPVTHLLVEDGINTRRSQRGTVRGPVTARLDWLHHTVAERRTMAHPPVPGWESPDRLPARWDTVLKFGVEQYHWAPLWRSGYTRDSLLQIVRSRPDLPVLVAFLGHTALTTPAEVADLRRELAEVAARGRRAELRVEVDPDGWHGYLVYAEYGATNLRAVRELRA